MLQWMFQESSFYITLNTTQYHEGQGNSICLSQCKSLWMREAGHILRQNKHIYAQFCQSPLFSFKKVRILYQNCGMMYDDVSWKLFFKSRRKFVNIKLWFDKSCCSWQSTKSPGHRLTLIPTKLDKNAIVIK